MDQPPHRLHSAAPTAPHPQRHNIFRPILLVWFTAIAVLSLVGVDLVWQFDQASRQREQDMVAHGFQQRISEVAQSIVPQVDWDDAVRYIDNRFSADWADKNLTTYLRTMADISQVFIVDSDNRLIYASAQGKRAPLTTCPPFASTIAALLPEIRAQEAARPRLHAAPDGRSMISRPIQTARVAQVAGQPVLVFATLVQPDFGTALPRLPRAPIVVTARPIDQAMLVSYASRYLIADMDVRLGGRTPPDRASVSLLNVDGHPAAQLSWLPRRPGINLLIRLLPAMAMVIVLIGYNTGTFVRKTATINRDLMASEARARHLAYHDGLTTLPNRVMMFERLGGILALSRRQFSQTAVHCLDLDRFKQVNDSLGHHAGDELIQQVAKRLIDLCREADTVARLGGDEFVILQPNTSSAGASHLAQRILKSFELPFTLQFGVVEVGVSIGVTLVGTAKGDLTDIGHAALGNPVIANGDITPGEALRQADLALYGSKENGRNRITFFEPDMDAALRMRRALETDLRRALADGLLTMVYQPQMDQQGHIASAEALVRWMHPEKGAISPTIFVALAEESGLILDLGEFIFRRVFAETADWPDMRIAINVSALQLRSPVFMALVTRLVAEFQIDPSKYEIEITETALLGHDGVTRDNITMLKQEGFTIALDDFGTGYSSLNSLKRFAIDTIKIDRSFIHNLEANVEAEALVDAIIKLAHALKLNIVAEGVETEAQRDRLMSCGCNHFQGYLISHPVPAADFNRLVLR